MNQVRVLLAGNWRWDIYEEALARGFAAAGCDVVPFDTLANGAPDGAGMGERFLLGHTLRQVNERFVAAVENCRPDLIFAWRCIELTAASFKRVRQVVPLAKIILYHNDNPYERLKARSKCRHYLAAHPVADIVAVYRPDNTRAAKARGARRVELLPASFIRERHRPLASRLEYDVSFVGHYEPDGRDRLLDALHRSGIRLHVQGTQWGAIAKKYEWLRDGAVGQVWGDEYSRLLSSSRVSLCFLSSRQGDVYTRRCFEIPACGSVLLAPRTDFLARCFIEGEEAEFWGSEAELVAKAHALLRDEARRARIALQGRERVLRDGHDEYARARTVLSWLGWPKPLPDAPA